MVNQPRALRRGIRLRNAVALYASSVLGSGVLVLPGLTAQIAGPGSVLAWILLSLASYPFAITFASLSSRKPETGGVYSFAKEAFSLQVARVTGWLLFSWDITGAPAVALIAASYLGYALSLSRAEIYIIAFAVIFATFTVNYRGIILSNKVQLAVIGSIIALLLVTIISSIRFVHIQNFAPFLPHGLIPVGTASALIFWSYLGYENVSNVAEEFADPKRDFRRSVKLSVVLISALYVSVALVTIGTRSYEAGGSIAPFAAILSNVLGSYGAIGTAVLSFFIIFGLINAYTTGMSRAFYAVSRDRGFPKALAHINSTRLTPDGALFAMIGCMTPVFLIYYLTDIDLETALLVSSGSAILVYVIGSMAGIKLLGLRHGHSKADLLFPCISLIISVIVLPFVGPLLVVSAFFIVAALVYSSVSDRRIRRESSSSRLKGRDYSQGTQIKFKRVNN